MVGRWLKDRRGITSIEYGMIAALVALGLVASLNSLGAGLGSVLSTVADALDGGSKTAPPPAQTNARH